MVQKKACILWDTGLSFKIRYLAACPNNVNVGNNNGGGHY
ncbi:hypothetical protein F0Z19_2295 [Vibrio cyclitrophicus]|nr:hypothetical protein F0Z19_2295 [Vibrio cyclitrophicus]